MSSGGSLLPFVLKVRSKVQNIPGIHKSAAAHLQNIECGIFLCMQLFVVICSIFYRIFQEYFAG